MSSSRQSHAIFTVLKKWSHAKSFHQYLHSRIMRVSLAQGSCQVLQILDVSPKTGTMLLFFKKKGARVILAQSGHAKFLCAKKGRATDSMQKRKSSFLRRIPNNLRSVFSVIFALLGEQSRVPAIRPSPNTVPSFVPELWPWMIRMNT